MSNKETQDLIARLQGCVTGMAGVATKLGESETPPASPPPDLEDVKLAKQLLEEAKGLVTSLEEHFKAQLAALGPSGEAGSASSKSESHSASGSKK